MGRTRRTTSLISSTAIAGAALALTACDTLPGGGAAIGGADHRAVVEASKAATPTPPWGLADELGMANALGAGTWSRCAYHMGLEGAQAYELSHIRSNTMPASPFGVPLKYEFRGTVGLPGTRHAFNGESLAGETAAQGTQMDALGHFGVLDEAWDGSQPFPAESVIYYGGYDQADVKPSADSPLLKLGIEKVPPIVTSAVLLDARTHLGGGEPLKPGETITAEDIEAMIEAQGLAWRGLLPGDVLYIYTGWSDNWADPDTAKEYYTKGPGLSYDAVKYIGDKAVVLVSLDNPFTDPVSEGQLSGQGPAPEGTPPDLPFAIHHQNLTQSGVHQIQNGRLVDLAKDKVWLSCTMILPLRVAGGSGSAVRPVAIGAPVE